MSLNDHTALVAPVATFFGIFWVTAIIVDKIVNYYDAWKRRHDCAHGVRGQCAKCDDEKAAEQRAERVAAEAAQRRQLVDSLRPAREQLESVEVARLRETIVPSIAELRKLSPYQFEDEMARVFERLGYSVEQTPYANDHGRDAILMKDGEKFLLECKKYGDRGSSGRPDLQKFHSAIISDKAKGGFFVTSGGFSEGALKFAPTANIDLIDAHELPRLMFKSLNSASQDDSYSSMCRECGDVVQHHIRSPEANTTCRKGHTVPATLSIDDIFSSRRRRKGRWHQSTRPYYERNEEGREQWQERCIRQWDGTLGYGFIDPSSPFQLQAGSQAAGAMSMGGAPAPDVAQTPSPPRVAAMARAKSAQAAMRARVEGRSTVFAF